MSFIKQAVIAKRIHYQSIGKAMAMAGVTPEEFKQMQKTPNAALEWAEKPKHKQLIGNAKAELKKKFELENA